MTRTHKYLIPVGLILRDYWHLEPYLQENRISLQALTELSFSVSKLRGSFDYLPPSGWSALSMIEEHFLCDVRSTKGNGELSDDEAIAVHHLTELAYEIHGAIEDMVRTYTPPPNYGYHHIQKWIGNNILIRTHE